MLNVLGVNCMAKYNISKAQTVILCLKMCGCNDHSLLAHKVFLRYFWTVCNMFIGMVFETFNVIFALIKLKIVVSQSSIAVIIC